MSIKVTSLLIDVMTRAVERPVPIALQKSSGIPLAPTSFPHDWSVEVTLETRWQTDVTRPSTGSTPEKWSLSTRPSRSLSARMVGAGKEEANAILQAALGYNSLFGVPVPIYPDATPITSVSGLRVFGDFRYRRFFEGGRVAIYPFRMPPHKSANGVIWATLKEVSPESILVELDPSTTRAINPLIDVVAPCMDVELVQSAKANSLTDELIELEIRWDEVDGACSLPATWPPTSPLNPEILSPFCQIVDNLPVFPLEPDWASGISIDATRDIDSSGSGRSSIQEPVGQAYHLISISVMGYDRPSCWNAVRFFDSMQGRARNFYLVHPIKPWRFGGIPSLDRVQIYPAGDVHKINQHYRRLAFFRSDGTFITRRLNAASDLGGAFLLTLLTDLPDDDFVDVQPVMICSFDQDNLVENWSTNTVVPALQLSIREEPEAGPVNVPNMGYQPADPGFLAIPGCNLLLRAGSGCSDGSRDPCSVWPAPRSTVSHWTDVSAGSNRSSNPVKIALEMVRTASPLTCDLIRFPQQWQNNGQPSIKDPRFTLQTQLDSAVPLTDKHLWSDEGWTLFLCFTPEPHTAPASNRTLVQVATDVVEFLIRVDTSGQSGAARTRLQFTPPSPGIALAVPLTTDISVFPYTVILTIRVDKPPAGLRKVRVWANGKQAIGSASSCYLDVPSAYYTSDWFPAFNRGRPTTSPNIASTFGVYGCANMVLSYNRPLDIDEINQVQTMISDIYRTLIETSVLY